MRFKEVDGRFRYVQVGIVSGGAGICGSHVFPEVYVRISNPSILEFIKLSLGSIEKMQVIKSLFLQKATPSSCTLFQLDV